MYRCKNIDNSETVNRFNQWDRQGILRRAVGICGLLGFGGCRGSGRSGCSCGQVFFVWKLGEDDGVEDQRAAGEFQRCEALVEQRDAAECREDGFQAEDQGCFCGWDVLLAEDLEGVADARGHDAAVRDGLPRVQDGADLRVLKDEHADDAHDSGHDELDGRELEAVALRRVVADQHGLKQAPECLHFPSVRGNCSKPKIGVFTGALRLRKLVHALSLPYIYGRQEGVHRLDPPHSARSVHDHGLNPVCP